MVRDYERTHGGTYVESVTIIRTDADAYPSGWNYSLHYGKIGGATLLRYDNAHEQEKGHERPTPDATETFEFLGMEELYRRFRQEIEMLPPSDTP